MYHSSGTSGPSLAVGCHTKQSRPREPSTYPVHGGPAAPLCPTQCQSPHQPSAEAPPHPPQLQPSLPALWDSTKESSNPPPPHAPSTPTAASGATSLPANPSALLPGASTLQLPASPRLCALTVALAASIPPPSSVYLLRFGGNCYL